MWLSQSLHASYSNYQYVQFRISITDIWTYFSRSVSDLVCINAASSQLIVCWHSTGTPITWQGVSQSSRMISVPYRPPLSVLKNSLPCFWRHIVSQCHCANNSGAMYTCAWFRVQKRSPNSHWIDLLAEVVHNVMVPLISETLALYKSLYLLTYLLRLNARLYTCIILALQENSTLALS